MGASLNRGLNRGGHGSARAALMGTAAAVVVGLAGSAIALGAAWGASAAAPGSISTIAGGVGGPGPARSTSIAPCGISTFKLDCGLAVKAGRVYFTDIVGQNLRAGVVRAVNMRGGKLTTPVGAGIANLAGDGGPARQAGLLRPSDVSFDRFGNMLISDASSVRVVAASSATFYGQPMTAGDIYTIAGGGDSLREKVPANRTSMSPAELMIDKSGNLVIADFGDNLVRVVAVKTGRFYGQSMRAGFIYAVAGGGTSTSNGVTASSAHLKHPIAVTTDSAGNIIIANQGYQLHVVAVRSGGFYGVRMTAGHLYSIAGNGQPWSAGGGGLATKAQIFANASCTRSRATDASPTLVTAAWRSRRGSTQERLPSTARAT